MGIGVRAAYLTAPSGDYVADVNAACGRFSDDIFGVLLKLNLRSLIGADVDAAPDPGDYIETVEDLIVISRSLDVLVRELGVIVPPADVEATHAQLIEGYQEALEAFRSLRSGGGDDEVATSAERVQDAARRLGVDCGL
jgi:hypothetical protein